MSRDLGRAQKLAVALAEQQAEPAPRLAQGEVMVRQRAAGFTQDVYTHEHHLTADEPVRVGGDDYVVLVVILVTIVGLLLAEGWLVPVQL